MADVQSASMDLNCVTNGSAPESIRRHTSPSLHVNFKGPKGGKSTVNTEGQTHVTNPSDKASYNILVSGDGTVDTICGNTDDGNTVVLQQVVKGKSAAALGDDSQAEVGKDGTVDTIPGGSEAEDGKDGTVDMIPGKDGTVDMIPDDSQAEDGIDGTVDTIPDDLKRGFLRRPKWLPCRCLYDAKGSQLYEQITQLEEYYPFRVEQELLSAEARNIAQCIPEGSIIVELGCGTAEKTGLLLQAVIDRHGPDACRFAGIDVSATALQEASEKLLAHFPQLPACNVQMYEADYITGLGLVRKRHPSDHLTICWLGSSIGNFNNPDAVECLKAMQSVAGHNVQLLVCTDLWKDPEVLYRAYNDSQGVTRDFIINGMCHALKLCGRNDVDEDHNGSMWEYHVNVNQEQKQVEMFVVAQKKIKALFDGVCIAAGEQVLVEISRKFTVEGVRGLAYQSGLHVQACWRSPGYGIHLMVPSCAALTQCWKATDIIFDSIDWSDQPIALRHPFCFYYGHVAAFSKLKALPQSDATPLDILLSRGIDPNMLQPDRCHSHPTTPNTWPTKQQLKQYVAQVRALLLEGCKTGACSMRLLCLALEHESMHQETLSYMRAQTQKEHFKTKLQARGVNGATDSSGGMVVGNGENNSGKYGGKGVAGRHSNGHKYDEGIEEEGKEGVLSDMKVDVVGGDVNLGVGGASDEVGFVWDNEGGSYGPMKVDSLLVDARPVSIAAFRKFVFEARGYQTAKYWIPEDFELMSQSGVTCPATWTITDDGDVFIHAPGRSQHWTEVAEHPVYVSLSEAMAYCRWKGCRIMTEPEYEHILATASDRVQMLDRGGWEWCSTEFFPYPGFTAMPEYPEYSTDFFPGGPSGDHYVLRGSSPFTPAPIVRSSFRNFYQRQYPYVFAKFRGCTTMEQQQAQTQEITPGLWNRTEMNTT